MTTGTRPRARRIGGREKVKAAALLLRAGLAHSRARRLLEQSVTDRRRAEAATCLDASAATVRTTRRSERLLALATRSHKLGAALATRAATAVLSVGVEGPRYVGPKRGPVWRLLRRLADALSSTLGRIGR